MKYTGPVFRPPNEANTPLLQVTVGCSHNKCTYCTMYKGTRFSIENINQIEKDLQEAKRMYGSLTRIFLLNGDAFTLKASKLKEISKKIIQYFPEMETITMYASIQNIKTKTDKELQELKDLRINDLYIGLESGSDEVIKHLNLGHSLNDAIEQLGRLNKVGIRHVDIFILGAAGRGKGIKNAINTAKLINKTKPAFVGFATLGIFDGSELSKEVKHNLFTPATELENLEEEKKLIELIEVENLAVNAAHPINSVNINGILPRDKEKIIRAINNTIKTSSKKFLKGTIKRSTL